MKLWHLIIVLLAVILAYMVVRLPSPLNFAEIFGRDKTKTTQSDVGKRPEVKATSRDVLELRRQQHLRPLTELEEGRNIQELPNGIFGFSMCQVASISASRGDTFSLEIHKHDGIVYYVGYASDEDIGRYLARPKNFHIHMSPHSLEKAPSLFEIPVDFVSKCEARASRDNYLFDLFITAIPELQS